MTGPSAGGTAVIVVLGAAVLPDGSPSPALARRIAEAARLNAAGRADRVIASGGVGDWPPSEARVIRDALVTAGVPPGAILEEDRARTTFENALLSIRLMRAHRLGRAILVTEGYHLPRALMTFRLLGVAAAGSAPAGRSQAPPARRIVALVREVLALPVYLVRALAWRLTRGRRG